VEAFEKLYLARMAEFNQSIFKPERITRQVDETAAVIRAAVGEESEAASFDRSVAGGSSGGRGEFAGGFAGDCPDRSTMSSIEAWPAV
jgi:hypothetical protein